MATTSVRDQEELRREGGGDVGAAEIVGRTPGQLFWVRFRRDKVALAALTFLLLLILVAALAGPITRAVAHPPDAQFPRALDPEFGTPTGPSSTFPFGVDKVGEDVFSRVLYGARVSLEVALVATFLSVAIGVVLGMVAGYYGGWIDTVISRVIDVTLAFPILLLALGIGSACSLGNGCAGGTVKPGLPTVIVAIVVINWTYIGRIIRGQVLSLREKARVVASNLAAIGMKVRTISVTHSTMFTRFCNVPKQEPNICPNVGWIADFHEPQALLDATFNGKNIVPVNNSNWPQLDDPRINALMDEAETVVDPQQRYAAWAKIDQLVTETAVAIPWLWETSPTLFSEHVTKAPEQWNQGSPDVTFMQVTR